MDFSKEFLFGAASAAYQVEGAVNEDGRGESTWDVFCRRPGAIYENHSGDQACDHYHRWREDIGIMQELNLQAYRFSIAWSRIMPTGEGPINDKGVAFYDHLIDGLLEAGIVPFITMFHWDLPQALQDNYGGWKSKETSKRFADYAAVLMEKYSDRVTNWFTHNEIKCFTDAAHVKDVKAPGGGEGWKAANQANHNAILGHGMAILSARAAAKQPIKIGLVEDPWAMWPVWDRPEHWEAARKAYRDYNNRTFYPVMEGRYDVDSIKEWKDGNAPEYTDEEMKVVATPMDHIGYNNYSGTPVRAADNEQGYDLIYPSHTPEAPTQWRMYPKGIETMLDFHREQWPDLPCYISENGYGKKGEKEEANGEVLDVDRKEYLRHHLTACKNAMDKGVDLRGYLCWSLMDNFEWPNGYSIRFGLTRVKYTTFERTIKLSGRYYADVIKTRTIL